MIIFPLINNFEEGENSSLKNVKKALKLTFDCYLTSAVQILSLNKNRLTAVLV